MRSLPILLLTAAALLFAGPRDDCLASPPRELRGVYMELHGSPSFGVYPLVPNGQWRKLFASLRELGVNAVFPNAVSPSGASYPSKVVPTRPPAECLFSPDLLDEITDAAHAEGIEVHVWTIEWYKAAPGTEENRLVRDASGKTSNTLCPSVPANRELMRRMLLELAAKYEVDGIQYDYMRLPGSEYCYCDACRGGFERETGRKVTDWPADVLEDGAREDEYRVYLENVLSTFVRDMYSPLKEAHPGLVISAAVWCHDSRDGHPGVRQDWGRWAREGWVDFLAPMNYGNRWILENFEPFMRNEARRVAGTVPLVFGMGAYQDTPENEVAQVRLGRELGGSGFIVYTLTERIMSEILPVLSREVWNEPALVPAFGR